MIVFEQISDLDLVQTLDCGQCFRWQAQPDGSYQGIAFGKSVVARREGDRLVLDGADASDAALWRRYFDLDTDYAQIRAALGGLHPVLKEAAAYASGIRLLRQEPFEALCTFIISQNNNIPRIKGIVSRFCEHFGDMLPDGGHAFPAADAISCRTADDLSPLRAGFRARYLIDAAKKVAAGEVDLTFCETADYDAARAELMKITGVGVKVADCTLLFGMHRMEAFPLDVWMKRAMQTLLKGVSPRDFGDYAGLAQQYIFHFSRMHPERFADGDDVKDRQKNK